MTENKEAEEDEEEKTSSDEQQKSTITRLGRLSKPPQRYGWLKKKQKKKHIIRLILTGLIHPPISNPPVERKKALTLGRRNGKILAAQLGMEHRATGLRTSALTIEL